MEESRTNLQEPQQETGPSAGGPFERTPLVSSPNVNAQPSAYQPPGSSTAIGYFTTIVAVLKIFSVILNLPTLSLLLYGYFAATLFRYTYGVQLCDWTKNPVTPEDCTHGKALKDQICENDNSYYKSIGKDSFIKICPSRWLIIPQMYFIGFEMAITFIVLIVLLFRHLSKRKTFIMIDFIGHLIAGSLTIVSSLCLFGYFGMVEAAEDMCSEKNFGVTSPPRISKVYKHSYRKRFDSNSDFNFQYEKSICLKELHDYYKKWTFLSAATIALINGVLYIVIALLTRTKYGQSKARPINAFKQQPWSMPQRSQMDQQQSYYGGGGGGYPPSEQISYNYKSTSYPKQGGFSSQQQQQSAYPQNPSQAHLSQTENYPIF